MVDIASLKADDAFRELVERWSKSRNRYHSDPSLENSFAYKLNSLDLGPGTRAIEIRYTGAGILGREWKGITYVIK
jgi:hypothetical protein